MWEKERESEREKEFPLFKYTEIGWNKLRKEKNGQNLAFDFFSEDNEEIEKIDWKHGLKKISRYDYA